MLKGINVRNADKLLMECAPFDEISSVTGWNKQQIIDYIDSFFRVDNPQIVSNNLSYFCWGRTKDEIFDDNRNSRMLDAEEIKFQIDLMNKKRENDQKIKLLKL